jgi:glycosyltransferase involved in cell wall biosynthesis
LLDAVRLLSGRLSDAVFVIEGVGPEEASLRDHAARLQIADRVRFIGEESNIANLYQASDIVVLPSVGYEDFPNTVIEAMAASRPVVASRIAGTVEQVVDGVTGRLVAPGRPAELADALASMGCAERRRTMGEAGRRRFELLFTAEHAYSRYNDLYRTLIG